MCVCVGKKLIIAIQNVYAQLKIKLFVFFFVCVFVSFKTARYIHAPSISVFLLWNDICHEMKLFAFRFCRVFPFEVFLCNWPTILWYLKIHIFFNPPISLSLSLSLSHMANGEVCSILRILLYRQVGGFLHGTPFSSSNKTDHHDIPVYAKKKLRIVIFFTYLNFQTTRKLVVFYIKLCLI